MSEAADLIVRQGVSLAQALTELKVSLTSSECDKLQKQRVWQRVLWSARNRYYLELASDPESTKRAACGMLRLLAQKLYELGDYDKSGAIVEKLAKIEGWVGIEGSVNVFAGLSQRDIDDMKLKLAAEDVADNEPLLKSERKPVN